MSRFMSHASCAFAKAILSGRFRCEKSIRRSVAERLGVECISNVAANNCRVLMALLRERSRFALKVTDMAKRLPFGVETRLMMGGLFGLQRLFDRGASDGIENIYALVARAQSRYGALTALPYEDIVRSITTFRPRRRGTRGK